MAHISITDMLQNSTYSLGEYTFSIALDYDSSLDATTVQVLCQQEGHELRSAFKQFPGQIEAVSWSIEANDTIADVYVIIQSEGIIYNVQPGDFVAHIAGDSEYVPHYFDRTFTLIGSTPAYSAGAVTTATSRSDGRSYTGPFVISDIQNGTWLHCEDSARPDYSTDVKVSNPITYNGRTYYYNESYGLYMFDPVQYQTIQDAVLSILQEIVTTSIREELIARFAINENDAGENGEDSGWTDPGDYNPDPYTVLNIEIDGSLSGRHNDPLNDTSYSYVPADQNSVAGYGCGGDGGHGGGGGAGASTIIVRKFGTDKANSKAIVARPKRHGYGSGGGKGGKGGDGCLIIYY